MISKIPEWQKSVAFKESILNVRRREYARFGPMHEIEEELNFSIVQKVDPIFLPIFREVEERFSRS